MAWLKGPGDPSGSRLVGRRHGSVSQLRIAAAHVSHVETLSVAVLSNLGMTWTLGHMIPMIVPIKNMTFELETSQVACRHTAIKPCKRRLILAR